MKIGVFNHHWATMGGGERFAGGIAEVLSHDHEVHLVSPGSFDVDVMGERLQLDLGRTDLRTVGDARHAIVEASQGYDLWINTSYMSHDPSRARASLLVVHFPARLARSIRPLAAVARQRVSRGLGARTTVPHVWLRGFYAPHTGHRHWVRWTDGEGEMAVVPTGSEVRGQVSIARMVPPAVGPVPVEIEVDGTVVATAVLTPPRRRFDLPLHVPFAAPARPDGTPSSVIVRSPVFVPADHLPTDDTRRLGVPVVSAPDAPHGGFRQHVVDGLVPTRFLRSYDVVASNSEFTKRFVDRWWGVRSEVLYPPVTMFEGGRKEPIVLSVGRFFHADRGHGKKQLEMVRAFGELLRRSERAVEEGWTLHLVGGCSRDDQPYLDEVRAAAAGLPVTFHVGVDGATLTDLYRRASVFWSATGLGEDPDTQPVRFEHFGISTVEAMSAGLVPVVLDQAGGREIVRPDDHGLWFSSEAELVSQTRRVIEDDELRRTLATAASVRARAFAGPSFAARLHEVVDLTLERARRG